MAGSTPFQRAPEAGQRQHVLPEWIQMTDLASATFGGRVLFATDEWFAPARSLLMPNEPISNNEYTTYGKWMDGWESRRKRVAGHDWCIIRLGLSGCVSGIMVDTAFFTGNQAPRFSLQGTRMSVEPVRNGVGADAGSKVTPFPETTLPGAKEALRELGKAWSKERIGSAASAEELKEAAMLRSEEWEEIIGITPLRPGYENGRRHYFAVSSSRSYSHLRLNIFPDGGVARLRVHGTVLRNWRGVPVDAELDLLAVENGGVEVACSNQHYGEPKNMIKPGRGINMGDGWETARKPDRPAVLEMGADGLVKVPGGDWAVLRLGAVGQVSRLVVDTNHFKGNFPESVSVDACLAPDAPPSLFSDKDGGNGAVTWKPLLPRHKAGASREHVFELSKGEIEALGPISHVKLSIMPDGGVMRLRAFGQRVVGPVRSML